MSPSPVSNSLLILGGSDVLGMTIGGSESASPRLNVESTSEIDSTQEIDTGEPVAVTVSPVMGRCVDVVCVRWKEGLTAPSQPLVIFGCCAHGHVIASRLPRGYMQTLKTDTAICGVLCNAQRIRFCVLYF